MERNTTDLPLDRGKLDDKLGEGSNDVIQTDGGDSIVGLITVLR